MTNKSRTGMELAIIGIAGRFPGSKSVSEFWENLVNGKESIKFLDEKEITELKYEIDNSKLSNFVPAVGGTLDHREYFDASFFGYTPIEAELMNPQIRIFHECVWHALEDAGYIPQKYSGNIGLYAAAQSSTKWEVLAEYSTLKDTLGSFAASQLAKKDFLGSRISYKLNLNGPSIMLNTACSSSLAAIHYACRGLLTGECQIALAGGVTIHEQYKKGYFYEEGMISSKDGHCRPFDENASGTIEGNGIGIVVLKLLNKALEDRDNIYAIIRGSAINNDGNRKVGFTAPSIDAQAKVVKSALLISKVAPDDISYIEAHGSGTPLGDSIEIEALKQAFNSNKKEFCGIGSVKSNIGHCDIAAGIAGLIKSIYILQNKQIPPTINFKNANPKSNLNESPFYVTKQLTTVNRSPFIIGVNSLGIGGTNVHMILEDITINKEINSSRDYQLFLISAQTETSLNKICIDLKNFIKNNPQINISDFAYTLNTGRGDFAYKKMILCKNCEEAIKSLEESELENFSAFYSPKDQTNSIAFVFSGLGGQYKNMTYDLYQKELSFKEELDNCFKIIKDLSEIEIKNILFSESENIKNLDINNFTISQLIVFSIEYSLARFLISLGLYPKLMIGYSFGEYTAACISGVISLNDAIRLITKRGELIQRTEKGIMLSIPLVKEEINPYLNSDLSLAIDNGESCVIAGPVNAIEKIENLLKTKKVIGIRLNSEYAIHSHLQESIIPEFLSFLKTMNFQKPEIPYISDVTGEWIQYEDVSKPEYWANHLTSTVLFSKGIENVLKESVKLFVEIGPGWDISALIKRKIADNPGVFVTNLIRPRNNKLSDQYYFLDKLGRICLSGVRINWNKFYKNEKRYRLSLPKYAFEPQKYWKLIEDFENGKSIFSKDLAKERNIANWFYSSYWKLQPGKKNLERENLHKIVLFLDEEGFGEKVKELLNNEIILVKIGKKFQHLSESSYQIDPKNYKDYEDLISSLNTNHFMPTHIIHMWGISNELDGLNSQVINKNIDLCFYSLLYLSKAIGRASVYNHDLYLSIITNNVHEVIGTETLFPGKATALGPCIVIPQEYNNIKSINIDLDNPFDYLKDTHVQNELLNDILYYNEEVKVAYRYKNRWVQRFNHEKLNDLENKPLVRENGIYWIIGGMGKIGYCISELLAQKCKAKLIITGLSELPPKESWNQYLLVNTAQDKMASKIRKIQNLEAIGAEVLYISANISEIIDVKIALKSAQSRFGDLDGVIHCADITGGKIYNTIEDISDSECESQFAAKVKGLLVLKDILKGQSIKFCLMFSSISSYLGGLKFSAYSAVNNFMNSFARTRKYDSKEQWIVINWDGSSYKNIRYAVNSILFSDSNINDIIFSENGNFFERYDRWVKLRARLDDNSKNKESLNTTLYQRPTLSNEYVAPRNEMEKKLANIWQSFFGIDKIGMTDDLFDLGGDSLKAINILSIIHKELEVRIPVKIFFDNSSIEAVAKYLLTSKVESYDKIMPAEKKEYYVLAPPQVSLFFEQEMNPTSTRNNVPMVISLKGNIDLERLKHVFKELIKRHECLRTSIHLIENQIVQKVHDICDIDIQLYETSEKNLEKISNEFVKPFDLSVPPLIRVGLFKINTQEHLLVIDLHHMVTDATSESILEKEFIALYAGKDLPKVKLHYKDFAEWKKTKKQKQINEQQKNYWLKKLSSNLPVLDLRKDFQRSQINSNGEETINLILDEDIVKKLKQISIEEETTKFMALLTCLNIFFHKISGTKDIVIGTPISCRRQADLQSIVGMLVNLIPLRNNIIKNESFKELLKKVKTNTLEAFDNQELYFDELVMELKWERKTNRAAIFDVIFNFQSVEGDNQAKSEFIKEYNLTVNTDYVGNALKHDISIIGKELNNKLLLVFHYSPDLFKRERIQQWVDYFKEIVIEVSNNKCLIIEDLRSFNSSKILELGPELAKNRDSLEIGFDF